MIIYDVCLKNSNNKISLEVWAKADEFVSKAFIVLFEVQHVGDYDWLTGEDVSFDMLLDRLESLKKQAENTLIEYLKRSAKEGESASQLLDKYRQG